MFPRIKKNVKKSGTMASQIKLKLSSHLSMAVLLCGKHYGIALI